MRTGRRIAFRGPGFPLECRTVEVPGPGPGEVLVRITHAGVCGSDVHRLAGELPDMGYPVAFGHEGVGTVDALGADVTTDADGRPLRPGDAVYWTTWAPASGLINSVWPPPADGPSHAAFQDVATLTSANAIYRIPEDTAADAVIALGCAMPTALGGFTRMGPVEPGQTVVVQGCGPVGLASTVVAGLGLAEQVIVIGAGGPRLDAAPRLGATTTIPLETSTSAERTALVRELTNGRGADIVIEATGVPAAFAEGMALLADGGRYLVLGLYAGRGTVALDPFRLNNHNLRVIGSLGAAGPTDYRTTIQLARRHNARLGLSDLVTHRFPLSATEEAIAVTSSGAAVKAVVMPTLDGQPRQVPR